MIVNKMLCWIGFRECDEGTILNCLLGLGHGTMRKKPYTHTHTQGKKTVLWYLVWLCQNSKLDKGHLRHSSTFYHLQLSPKSSCAILTPTSHLQRDFLLVFTVKSLQE